MGDNETAYVDFLKSIGIPKSRIRINLCVTPRKNIRNQKKYWSELLSLPSNCFAKTRIYKRQPKGYDYGKIEVWVAGLPRKTRPGKPSPSRPTWPAASIKFTFFMASVYLGAKIMSSERNSHIVSGHNLIG